MRRPSKRRGRRTYPEKLTGLAYLAGAIAVLVSGCTGLGPANPASQTPVVAPSNSPAQFSDTTGGIEGIVVDDSLAPIPDAQVALSSPSLYTTTLPDGSFRFSYLPPGPAVVSVAKTGFSSATASISIEESRVINVRVVLENQATLPRVTVIPFKGYISCGVGTQGSAFVFAGVCDRVFPPTGKQWGSITVDQNVSTVVNEASWRPVTASSGQTLRLQTGNGSYYGENSTLTQQAGEMVGTSPLRLRHEAPIPSIHQSSPVANNLAWFISTPGHVSSPPFVSFTLQQPVEIYLSVFWVQPAPKEYSALPDQ